MCFSLPQSILHKEWDPVQYFVETQPAYVKCSTMYRNSVTNEKLFAQIGMYTDVNNAFTAFEHSDGEDEIIVKGIKVYHSSNIDYNTAIWLVGNCIWRCYGHIDDDQLLTIVESVLGGIKFETNST